MIARRKSTLFRLDPAAARAAAGANLDGYVLAALDAARIVRSYVWIANGGAGPESVPV
jgi:hypothetical protein